MENKKLIIFLIILLIYVFYVNPMNLETDSIKTKLMLKKQLFYKQKSLLDSQVEIKKYIKKLTAVINKKDKRFYDAKSSSDINFNDIQKRIKKISYKTNCTLERGTWGEVVKSDDYKLLPFRVNLVCGAEQMYEFINYVYNEDKFLIFQQVSIRKDSRKNVLKMTATIYGFKKIKKETL